MADRFALGLRRRARTRRSSEMGKACTRRSDFTFDFRDEKHFLRDGKAEWPVIGAETKKTRLGAGGDN